MNNTENLLDNQLQLDPIVKKYLSQSASWAKWRGFIGILLSSMLLLILLYEYNNIFNSGHYIDLPILKDSDLNSGIFLILLAGIAVTWFFASLFNFNFGVKMLKALQNGQQQVFSAAMSNLSRANRLLGMVTVVYLFLIILFIFVYIFFLSFRRY